MEAQARINVSKREIIHGFVSLEVIYKSYMNYKNETPPNLYMIKIYFSQTEI